MSPRLQADGGVVVEPPVEWLNLARPIAQEPPHPMQQVRPIRQHVFGRGGVYTAAFEEQSAMTLQSYSEYARQQEESATFTDTDEGEAMFWRGMAASAPLYCSDSDIGSLFNPQLKEWNLGRMVGGPNGDLLQHATCSIPGLNKPMLYYGTWRTFFALHTEDSELQGVSFLHFGANKVWYVVPPCDALRVRRLAADLFPSDAQDCPNFLRHKLTMLSPQVLRASNIKCTRLLQQPGTFVLVEKGAFHFGFNLGRNAAEAVNFALTDWLPVGRTAVPCTCNGQTPHVDAASLIRRLRACYPDETQNWWAFCCACGQHQGVTNFDDERDHPSGELFECSGCANWGHIACYPEYATIVAEEGAADDLEMFCVQCRDAWKDTSHSEDHWYFTCVCGRNEGASSEASADDAPTGRMFECTTCRYWSHTECYTEFRGVDDDDLPLEMLVTDANHGPAPKAPCRGARSELIQSFVCQMLSANAPTSAQPRLLPDCKAAGTTNSIQKGAFSGARQANDLPPRMPKW
eukprot:CAMPEP_0119305996 /NCGR_PEP_ID=MMETSP1333-20130426/6848_1 /TAXON_ID=418940 /ORGANISM="Scyphosphaera apsteinii, Strain RCC1455" /LENGTH=517 /DNA_ID=CAMNT_0007309199 /DNA_START=241 /DNA_END=1792 /DNA_ORIENTATION=-